MAEVMTVSSSQGRPAEWHDQRLTTPTNADKALENRNEHWIGDKNTSEADKTFSKNGNGIYKARTTKKLL